MPCVLHLDHAESASRWCDEAVALGFTSVMYDGSRLDDETNRARPRAPSSQRCHAAGVSVEAELGEIGGKDGVHAPGVRTDPAAAAQFVADSGVDALAVAVGSSHAMTEPDRGARPGARSRAIHERVPVPLVLHGSSGCPGRRPGGGGPAGMTKVNIATHLNNAFTAACARHLAEDPDAVDTRRYLGSARDAVAVEAARLLVLLALR